jgi:DNA excision repair protein ERCC-2
MCALKQSLDGQGTSVLEMPSGTGKTGEWRVWRRNRADISTLRRSVTLLSFILSYKLAKPETGKLIYCSRTVGEIEKVLEEAKVVIGNIEREVPGCKRTLVMGLSSRRNLCIHPRVREEKYARTVDSKCREMVRSSRRSRL